MINISNLQHKNSESNGVIYCYTNEKSLLKLSLKKSFPSNLYHKRYILHMLLKLTQSTSASTIKPFVIGEHEHISLIFIIVNLFVSCSASPHLQLS